MEPMTAILDAAAAEGRTVLMEHEVYQLLKSAGCRVPRFLFIPRGAALSAEELRQLGSATEVALKVVSPRILHKSDVGGVLMVRANLEAIHQRMDQMLEGVPEAFARRIEARPAHGPEVYRGLVGAPLREAIAKDIRGVLVVERVRLEDQGAGSEMLCCLRHNREFGPVLTLGVGGVDTELWGSLAQKGQAVVNGSAALLDEVQLLELFRTTLAYRRLTGETRTGRRLVEDEAILKVIGTFLQVARLINGDEQSPWDVLELEVNPLGAVGGELIALDGLLRFAPRPAPAAARPQASLAAMMRPQSVAVIGVSAKGINMGRIILRNIIAAGFDPRRAYVIRPDTASIDEVRCVPNVEALPEKVDLFVMAVSANQVPELMEQLAEHDKAVGVILIPGGMGEKEGGQKLEDRTRDALAQARRQGQDLVACGGNSLGIVSRPGSYHTIFIPQNKLPLSTEGRDNIAFLSQSGAYMISRMSKLSWLSPRYAISAGNQVDLTASDYLRYLADDPAVHTFAVYMEGFQDGDGLAFARVVAEITRGGRDVIFYKAGRTAEGQTASSGHTASLAGDYDVCEAILRRAGAHVAKTFTDYLDLTKISCLMGSRPWRGRRLAALSNAGFEAVGMADALHGEGYELKLAHYTEKTRALLSAGLAQGRLDTLVDVRNPLDITPMASDEVHEQVLRAFFEDPGVDLVLCATVPLTPAMATLAEGVPEEQSIRSAGSLVGRLARLIQTTDKPVVASVDSGALYDPMCQALENAGIPTFRSADQALRSMGLYLEGKLLASRG